jgi:NAD(P)-dependent dehydrogenase (short-subunit alcohol dehydrogenase family)
MSAKTWFITGASSGFGREWSRAALGRGDRVAGTSREIGRLDDLAADFGAAFLPLELDVIDREADFEAVRRAHEHFGQLDVVVNNAGYGQYGVVEELTEQEIRRQVDTNFFGPIWITQAALPLLRARGSGHILQVSSSGGHFSAASMGLYCSSKWALEGVSQALAAEVAPFGIRLTIIEPSGFNTNAEASSLEPSQPLDAYEAQHRALNHMRTTYYGPGSEDTLGDPRAAAAAVMAIVDSDEPPLRVFFGAGGLPMIEREYTNRLDGWRTAQAYTEMSAARTGARSRPGSS